MLRFKISAALAVVFALGTFLGCESECPTCPDTPRDTIPPRVVSVSPVDGAKDVPVTTEVTVTFSESVDPTTVNIATFKVMNGDEPVAGAASAGSPTATFVPADSLEYLTTYTAVVSGVKDMAGNTLGSPYEWEFTTMQDPLWTLDEGYQMKDVTVDASGVYVTGTTFEGGVPTYDFFVAQFHLDGERGWFEEVSTEDVDYGCVPGGIAVSDGSVYVGRMEDPLGLGLADIYVDKRDANTGEIIWSTLVVSNRMCFDLAVDETAVYIVTSPDVFKLDVESGVVEAVLPRESIGGTLTSFHSVAVDANTVYVGGGTFVDGYDFFVVTYDKEFQNQRWLSRWGDSNHQFNSDLALLSDAGLVYLAGFSGVIGNSTNVTALVAFDLANGEFRWSKDLQADLSPYIIGDGSGALYAALGDNSQTPLKLRSDGGIEWVASPPLGATAVAVSGGTVFAVDNTNVLARYDVATGARH